MSCARRISVPVVTISFLCHPMPWSFSLSSPFLSQLMINPVINSEPSEGNPREANGGWKDYHILILFSSPRFSRCNSSDKGSGHVAPSSLHRHWSGVIYALQRHRVRRSERAEGMRWGTSRETDPPNQDLTFLSPVGCGRDRNEWRERSVPSYIPFSFRSGMRREPWAKSVAWGWRTGTKNEESFCDRQGTPEDREGGLIPTKKDKGNEWKTLWWDHLPFMIHSWGSSFLSPARLWLADCRWRARRRPGTKEATTDDHSHLMLASCLSVAHASLPPSLASDRHEMGMKGRSRCHAFSSSSQFTRWLATLSHLIQGRSDRDRRERGTTGRDETRPAVTNGEWLVVTVPLIPHSFVSRHSP